MLAHKEETLKIEGIVINIYQHDNDKNAKVKICTSKGVFFILAKGFFSKKSKNKSNIIIGSIVEFEIFKEYGNKHLMLLKKAKLKNSLPQLDNTTDIFYKRLLKILQKIENSDLNLINIFKDFLQNYNKNYQLWFITFFYYKILLLNNKKMEVNYCLVCHKNKNLFFFDPVEWGVFCYEHYNRNNYEKSKSWFSKELIKSLYFLNISFEQYCYLTEAKINQQIFMLLESFDYYY